MEILISSWPFRLGKQSRSWKKVFYSQLQRLWAQVSNILGLISTHVPSRTLSECGWRTRSKPILLKGKGSFPSYFVAFLSKGSSRISILASPLSSLSGRIVAEGCPISDAGFSLQNGASLKLKEPIGGEQYYKGNYFSYYHSLSAELKQASASLDSSLNFSQLQPRKYSLQAQQHQPLRNLNLGSWEFILKTKWNVASVSSSLMHFAAIPKLTPNFTNSSLSFAVGKVASVLSLSSLGMSCLTRWQMARWWGVGAGDSLMDSRAETTMHTYSFLPVEPLLSISSRTKLKYLTASGNISSCLQTSPIFLTSPASRSSPSSRQERNAPEKCWKALLHLPRSNSHRPRLLRRWARLQGVSMPSYQKIRQFRARSRQSCFLSQQQRFRQALAIRLRSLERSSVRLATFFLISSLRADSRNR